MSKAPSNTNQFNSSTKVLAAVVCLALLLSTTPLVTAKNGKPESWNWPGLFSQGHQNRPRREAPEGVFPNLDEMRRSTDDRRRYGAEAPRIPAPIPSTRRRWRRELRAAGTGAPTTTEVSVDFNALLAFASTPSTSEIPWLTNRESKSVSDHRSECLPLPQLLLGETIKVTRTMPLQLPLLWRRSLLQTSRWPGSLPKTGREGLGSICCQRTSTGAWA